MSNDAVQYREIRPAGALAQFVRCIWRLHGSPNGGAAEPIIPDGCAEVVVNLGDPFIRHTSVTTSHRQPARLVAGQITRALTLEPSGRIDLWGIRLHPWSVASFLGTPASELRDSVVPLEDIEPALDAAFETVPDGRTEGEAERSIIEALTHYASGMPVPEAGVPRLIAYAAAASESVSVGRLAREAGVSTRRIQTLFRDHVGLSPKQLLRVTRFQHALRLARTQPELSWSRIAHIAGYYDQAHLIHDSNAIAGCTPRALVSRDASLTEAFLTDDPI